jgi:diguanylate cyclase (GGDEF)-like protein
MTDAKVLVGRGRTTQHYRRVLYTCQGLVALSLLAIIALPSKPAAEVAALALLLMAVQHFVSRRLGDKSVELIHSHEELLVDAEASRSRMEDLFAMTDMLQSAETHEDAGAVLRSTAMALLPDLGGALYVFNNSGDRLDLALSWSPEDKFKPADMLVPSNCWALKRGKPHVNDPATDTLCCLHHDDASPALELPMVARGTVYGLLMISAPESAGAARLEQVRRTARALADSMSLALSNIALREKLRTQSLRDPLTGLYNRRYMEDALDRYLSMAERTGESTAVIMVDLDHFKALNDKHGHAKGDAVLRDVASQLVGALRPADVVSRYGGEELLIILPNCPLEDAELKAEMLRSRIEALSESAGVPVSASFGVASVPETSSNRAEAIPMADAALYTAKQGGRNCVRVAEARRATDVQRPRLAVG